jgi:hypothetical protein
MQDKAIRTLCRAYSIRIARLSPAAIELMRILSNVFHLSERTVCTTRALSGVVDPMRGFEVPTPASAFIAMIDTSTSVKVR